MSVRLRVNLQASGGCRGFTLVEAIVSMLLISIAAIAMASAMGLAFSHSSDNLVHTKSVQLARSYLEEILARRFDENTPVGGLPPCSALAVSCSSLGNDAETRSSYDDVDDYHGLDESPPQDAQGNVIAGFAGYRVRISVSYANASQISAWSLDASDDAKVVVVEVISPDLKSQEFTAVKGNY